jgi:hypothetical protein
MKGVRRFGIKGKLAPRYIGPYPIIDKYGPTSYQVEVPVKLLEVHNVFHVSQLNRYLKPPTDVVIKWRYPPHPHLLLCFHFNLGTRFSLGGGAVTPHVTKTIIKVINK